MCGFSITRENPLLNLSHRGNEHFHVEKYGWQINFYSLPLSSNKTGLYQPLEFRDKLVVFNGEIFNYKDFGNYQSDLHYLAELFTKMKVEEVYAESAKWDGFWSICSISEAGIMCFTDLLSKKQLYWSKTGISSEIKPLFSDTVETQDYSEENFNSSATNFNGVFRIIPGKLYGFKPDNFYPLEMAKNNYIWKQSGSLYDIIDKSVKDRVENRINGVSLFLSGGLDSNIILHHLKKYVQDIEIISIENNETEQVNKIADKYNLNIKKISDYYNEVDFYKAVFYYESSLDYGSLMPNYLLFKACTNSMVFTGDGADEFFGGYSRNLTSDTFMYDVYSELPYYHNIRIDRMSMMFTIEARSPLMSYPLLRYAHALPWELRKNKSHLRDTYKDILMPEIIQGTKVPLRFSGDKNFNLIKTKSKFNQIWQSTATSNNVQDLK